MLEFLLCFIQSAVFPYKWMYIHSVHWVVDGITIVSVTEILFVDESSKQELLSLLGDWYKPKSFDSIFSSIVSNAVFFSS